MSFDSRTTTYTYAYTRTRVSMRLSMYLYVYTLCTGHAGPRVRDWHRFAIHAVIAFEASEGFIVFGWTLDRGSGPENVQVAPLSGNCSRSFRNNRLGSSFDPSIGERAFGFGPILRGRVSFPSDAFRCPLRVPRSALRVPRAAFARLESSRAWASTASRSTARRGTISKRNNFFGGGSGRFGSVRVGSGRVASGRVESRRVGWFRFGSVHYRPRPDSGSSGLFHSLDGC